MNKIFFEYPFLIITISIVIALILFDLTKKYIKQKFNKSKSKQVPVAKNEKSFEIQIPNKIVQEKIYSNLIKDFNSKLNSECTNLISLYDQINTKIEEIEVTVSELHQHYTELKRLRDIVQGMVGKP